MSKKLVAEPPWSHARFHSDERLHPDERFRKRSWASAMTSGSRFLTMLSALVLSLCFVMWSLSPFISTLNQEKINTAPVLRFTNSRTFQISIFEDLHFGENAWEYWGPMQDILTMKVMSDILDYEPQQLVVLNGDLITGENTFAENSTDYVDQLVAPLVQHGVRWASTYGNHDHDFNLSAYSILGRERTYSNSLTGQEVFTGTSGISNYHLLVYPSDGGSEPCLILWFFDSRGGSYYQQRDANGDHRAQPNWVDRSVVSWFEETSANLHSQYGKTIPSLAFVHIPTNASRALQSEAGVDPHYQPGINDDYTLAQQSQGWCSDGTNDASCDYGGQDEPFMEAIASTPGMIALFSGHDHGDTWCFKWDSQLPGMSMQGHGVNLCFGQHSGYGGYGSWTRGSRQILVTEDKLRDLEIDTWIRLENGDVVGSITLNSTYGQDAYPATNNTFTHCSICESG